MHTIRRSDEEDVQVEELIQAFGLYIVNDAAQPPIYWTPRGSSFINVTWKLSFVGSWTVRTDWTTQEDTRQADWDRYAESLVDHS